jgi:exodeoxyribonuclease VII large subunit
MGRTAKSQWEFGELFEPSATRRVYSVSELTGSVRRLLEKQIGQVWVGGEISNLREQASGHIYFSLKDAASQLQCVCFRNDARPTRHLLQEGQKVLLQGDLTVYEARGQYQLIVRAVEAQGVGALQLAFERLKQKLQAEGLFAPARKRALPRFPQRLGIVTSPTGAALQDVIHVVRRRHPGLELVLAPCRVQGAEAVGEIAAAIRLLNEWAAVSGPLDLILVTRGGGSLEDLWAFNEEAVARAIFESKVPVVSAVGHEIDFTISDFVADLRAATPSAAAELITEGFFASRENLAELVDRLIDLAHRHFEDAAEARQQLGERLVRLHPRRQVQEQAQRLDDSLEAMARAARQGWRAHFGAWETLAHRLLRARPSQDLQERSQRLGDARRRLMEGVRQKLVIHQQAQTRAEIRLRLLSPLSVLQRGYSVTTDAATGRVLRDQAEVRPGQRVSTRLQSGSFQSVVSISQPAEDQGIV